MAPVSSRAKAAPRDMGHCKFHCSIAPGRPTRAPHTTRAPHRAQPIHNPRAAFHRNCCCCCWSPMPSFVFAPGAESCRWSSLCAASARTLVASIEATRRSARYGCLHDPRRQAGLLASSLCVWRGRLLWHLTFGCHSPAAAAMDPIHVWQDQCRAALWTCALSTRFLAAKRGQSDGESSDKYMMRVTRCG